VRELAVRALGFFRERVFLELVLTKQGLQRLFEFGFTTKKDGHGHGARFILRLPMPIEARKLA
jgi:hypothetical protein